MELYSKPLDRVIYGRNNPLTQHTSQRAMFFKYATIIKAFLAYPTADILRMRLQQAADGSFMSLKNFLDCHLVNLTLALKYNQGLLLLVYPGCEISPDLSTWNTRLLCLVLRASNCLSVREQDDVIYIAKMYRKYFSIRRQKTGSGTITKKGHLAKREWIRTCSAVQRLVEVVDDAGLMKELRNFICKVEMEEKKLITREDTQIRLEALVSEMVKSNPWSKHREENLTDEAKQMVKRKLSGLSSKRRQLTMRKPQSASARIGTNRKRFNLEDDLQKSPGTLPRSKEINTYGRSATSTNLNMPKKNHNDGNLSERKGKEIDQTHANVKKEVELDEHRLKSLDKQKDRVRKRAVSAIERKASTNQRVRNRPQSANDLKAKVTNSGEKITHRSLFVKDTVMHATKHRNISSRPGSAREKEKGQTISIMKVQRPLTPKEINHRYEKTKDTLTKSEPLSRSNSKRINQTNREDSNLSFIRSRPSSGRMSTLPRTSRRSRKGENGNRKRTYREAVIRVPTAEPGFTKHDDANQSSDEGKLTQDKTLKTKERMHGTGNIHKEENKRQEKETTQSEPDEKDIKREQTDDGSKGQISNDKRKVFDDNMKKIANDVLVHQQIHEAVKNPLLQNKEFVDEFFSFLNENRVTKKFLRAQCTEPNQSWKLPSGKQVNFCFFVAFVFRHIVSKDVQIVSYVVEKMLLRMKCKHSWKKKPFAIESNKAKNEPIDIEERKINTFPPEHERRRRTYREISSLFSDERLPRDLHASKTSRNRSVSRERSCSAGKLSRRSRSASKDRALTERDEEKPKLYRSTSITDNQCWKCLQKDAALTACVNWSNRCLCDLFISEGVPYTEEHLSAAVKANDLITLVKVVEFLKNLNTWNASSKESKDALFLAKKLRIHKMTEFLIEEGVEDERIVNQKACSPCFIA